jgi:hypothetical protein
MIQDIKEKREISELRILVQQKNRMVALKGQNMTTQGVSLGNESKDETQP